ncbi:MAG: GGDEF domain-containing protein [Candidatus Thiodiazotropha sp. (ex Ctena orbiculata)]|nr:GGDEF domain-containing protein [Candidatus Thiodiazotropha taylori]MCG8039390.1 GGDEF domain-containing protein [Candidatus Thiodiazotropha taylori]
MANPKTLSEVDEQLIKQLFDNAWAILIAGQVVAVMIFVGLRSYVDPAGLYVWIGVFTVVTMIRLFVVGYWKRQFKNLKIRIWYYAIGAVFAGGCWAGLVLFLTQPIPIYQQLFILITLVGMPIAAMPSNSIYLLVYTAFVTPILIAIGYWSLFIIGDLNVLFFGIGAAYSFLLFKTAGIYHNNLRQSITVRLENKSLVDELSKANQKLEQMAYYDPLTCLANRRWFQARCEEAVSRSNRNQTRLALLLIDVDNFKQVNDQQGHAVGDDLLISLAERLTATVRQTDTMIRGTAETARYGGDEFVVLLDDVKDRQSIELIVDRIFTTLNTPIKLKSNLLPVTVSIGIAITPDDATDFSALIHFADVAMYRAKSSGRNRYRFYSE